MIFIFCLNIYEIVVLSVFNTQYLHFIRFSATLYLIYLLLFKYLFYTLLFATSSFYISLLTSKCIKIRKFLIKLSHLFSLISNCNFKIYLLPTLLTTSFSHLKFVFHQRILLFLLTHHYI